MDQSGNDQELISLEGEDGKLRLCRLLGIFPFEGKEYALLLSSAEPNAEPVSGPPVLMRLVVQGDQAVFQNIESDEEFERVMTFVKETAREMDVEVTSS